MPLLVSFAFYKTEVQNLLATGGAYMFHIHMRSILSMV